MTAEHRRQTAKPGKTGKPKKTGKPRKTGKPEKYERGTRSYTMSHIRGKDTSIERMVRSFLFAKGLRFRKNDKRYPGHPDVVLPKYRTIIFVNGCFWHGHKGCHSYTVPKTNTGFWQDKVARNRARDLTNAQRLESIGWSVMTVWECELGKSRLRETIDRVEATLQINKDKWAGYRRRRRENRQFAIAQARKRREVAAIVEAELAEQFGTGIPESIRKISKKEAGV